MTLAQSMPISKAEKILREQFNPTEFDHIVRIERPGDRPVTNIIVDDRLWAAITDDLLMAALHGDRGLVGKWAENVVKSLLKCLQDGVDIWAEALWNTKYDFLMRCVP